MGANRRCCCGTTCGPAVPQRTYSVVFSGLVLCPCPLWNSIFNEYFQMSGPPAGSISLGRTHWQESPIACQYVGFGATGQYAITVHHPGDNACGEPTGESHSAVMRAELNIGETSPTEKFVGVYLYLYIPDIDANLWLFSSEGTEPPTQIGVPLVMYNYFAGPCSPIGGAIAHSGNVTVTRTT